MRAILFDLDDTLAPEAQLTPRAFREAAQALATEPLLSRADPAALASAAALAARTRWQAASAGGTLPTPVRNWIELIGIGSGEGLWADFEVQRGSLSTPSLAWLRAHRGVLRRGPWLDAARALGTALSAVQAEHLGMAFARRRAALQTFAPGAREVLATLRDRGLRIGVVTNGIPDLQRRKVALMGLQNLVDIVVVSGEVGVGKPHPGPYFAALSRLGIPASAAVMVGDNHTNDVIGARAAGLDAVWLRMDGVGARPGVPTITSLHELPRLL